MSLLFKRLAKAAPIAFSQAFRGESKSSFAGFRFPFGAVAAVAGGASYFYYFSSPNLGLLMFDRDLNLYSPKKKGNQDKNALNPNQWIEFKLEDRAPVSHNTHLFRMSFKLKMSKKIDFNAIKLVRAANLDQFSFDPSAKLGLDIASCIITRAPIGQQDAEGKPKFVIRPYTPISDPDAKGHFDLLIKVYPEGKMSQHFASLKPGDKVEVKGLVNYRSELLSLQPIEKLKYRPNMKKHIGMIAGGSGITPMLQVIEAILKNPDDNTQISLLYANVSPDDILLKKKLDVLAATHPNLKIFYTVDSPTKEWRGGSGFISKDMVLKGLPPPSDDTLIFVCGPPGMMNHVSGEKDKREQGELSGVLKEVGYTENMVYKF
nr:NADH-cytochrome B5 reductase-like protein [Ipomoea batatas]